MSEKELLLEQNTLLRALLRTTLDEQMDSTQDKARFLSQFDLTHEQIAAILDRSRPTITTHISEAD